VGNRLATTGSGFVGPSQSRWRLEEGNRLTGEDRADH